MKRELCEQIFDKYPEVVAEAARTAPDVARGWGAHKNDGGLVYATYKALVRRDGVYHSSSAGHRNFNAELCVSMFYFSTCLMYSVTKELVLSVHGSDADLASEQRSQAVIAESSLATAAVLCWARLNLLAYWQNCVCIFFTGNELLRRTSVPLTVLLIC
jgi:hypothetical protein